jgi:hypothetical protein
MLPDTDNFLDVLDQVCPAALDAPGQSIAEKISHCMRTELDPNKFQSLQVLLGLSMDKPINLYCCSSHDFVDVATEIQALQSAKNLKDHAVVHQQRRCYAYW